jgi:hypothetical protein
MKIVINDANILIDLAKLDLLDVFSKLPFDLYTTDFVYEELNEEQKSPVSVLHKKGYLKLLLKAKKIELKSKNDLLSKSVLALTAVINGYD